MKAQPRKTVMRAADPHLADLVALLRHEIAAAHSAYLPPFKSLAASLGISVPTLLRAARELRASGELLFGRGQRTRIPGRVPVPPPAAPGPAHDGVLNLIRENIASGAWRKGEALPKMRWFTGTLHVSDHTVTYAFGLAEQDGLIHRVGKRRIVGPRPAAEAVQVGFSPRFALVVQEGLHNWQWLIRDDRTEQFANVFAESAAQAGIELIPVLTQPRPSSHPKYLVYTAGAEAIRAYIRERSHHYVGALLSSHIYPPDGVAAWAERLLAHRKPVVWFDFEYRGLPQPVLSPLFTRCSMREADVSACAARALLQFGHRKAAFAYDPTVPWQAERLAQLQAAAGGTTELELVPVVVDRRTALPAAAIERLRAISRLPAMELDRRLAAVRSRDAAAPTVLHALADPRLTALVAPNDEAGHRLFELLAALGVEMPTRFSLLSFDNYRSYRALPMTTIDFGFGQLGYLAFQSLLNILPVARDRTNSIYAKPFVCHRFSLGPARPGVTGP